jgi:hypothetical protein
MALMFEGSDLTHFGVGAYLFHVFHKTGIIGLAGVVVRALEPLGIVGFHEMGGDEVHDCELIVEM